MCAITVIDSPFLLDWDEYICEIINNLFFSFYNFIEAIRKEIKFKNVQHKEIEDCIQKYLAQRPFVVKRKKVTMLTNIADDDQLLQQ